MLFMMVTSGSSGGGSIGAASPIANTPSDTAIL
jgi:hypothetical protein